MTPLEYWFGNYAPSRVLFEIGDLRLYWYGVLVTFGIVCAGYIAWYRYRTRGGEEKQILDFLMYAVIGGLIGARLWHVFVFQWAYYSSHVNEIFRIWEGGIAIQGALLGGALAGYWYARRHHISFLSLADATIVGVPLGQALGRWGNFFNQELYGMPTNKPWGIFITPENRADDFLQYTHFHPTFFYESVLNVLLFLILWQGSRTQQRQGVLVAWYCIGYGCIRFLVDILRIDPMPMMGPLRSSQVISLLFIVCGCAWIVWQRFGSKSIAK